MPPEPPRPRRSLSKSLIVEERVEPGAVHEFRSESFGERRTAPPREFPAAKAVTSEPRPRPSNPPPREFVSPLPKVPKELRDSREITTDCLLKELAEKGEAERAAKAEADELRRQLRERLPIESEPPTEKQIRKAKVHAAIVKLIGALTALAAAVATYLSVTAHTEIAPRVDNVVAKQDAQKAESSDLPERVKKIENYLRAMGPIVECKEAHERSAFKRATGYDLTTLSDRSPVHWSSEGSKPNLTWFPVEQCVSPGSPMPSIP